MIPDAAWFGLAISAAGGTLGLGVACVKMVWNTSKTMTSIDARLITADERDKEIARRLTQVEDAFSTYVAKSRSDFTELRERLSANEANVRWSSQLDPEERGR